MAETDFLSFLVDETFKLQKSGEVELSSLELKMNDYGLKFLRGQFIPQFQVLRFVTKFGVLDVPVNWSVFAVEAATSDTCILSEQFDPDFLFKVLKSVWYLGAQKILVTHADGYCYLVGFSEGEEVHLHDLLNPQEWLKTA
ncbi:MAG TPA: hypothetical protein VNJ01_14565 [Bacteriovoracaceae bacterium]|nr:hypothetical protein [Bacteriovoracaceae bacterium]